MNGSRKNENSWRRGAPPFFKVRLWDSILQTLHSIVMQKTYGISIYDWDKSFRTSCTLNLFLSYLQFELIVQNTLKFKLTLTCTETERYIIYFKMLTPVHFEGRESLLLCFSVFLLRFFAAFVHFLLWVVSSCWQNDVFLYIIIFRGTSRHDDPPCWFKEYDSRSNHEVLGFKDLTRKKGGGEPFFCIT